MQHLSTGSQQHLCAQARAYCLCTFGATQLKVVPSVEYAQGGGAREVFRFEEPMAEYRCRLPVSEATGSMVVDIGVVHEVAVISLNAWLLLSGYGW